MRTWTGEHGLVTQHQRQTLHEHTTTELEQRRPTPQARWQLNIPAPFLVGSFCSCLPVNLLFLANATWDIHGLISL
jgi:hypothetical protein